MNTLDIIKFRLALAKAGFSEDDLKLDPQEKDVNRVNDLFGYSAYDWVRKAEVMARKITHADKAWRRAVAVANYIDTNRGTWLEQLQEHRLTQAHEVGKIFLDRARQLLK